MAKATRKNTRRACKQCSAIFYVQKPSDAGHYCSKACDNARKCLPVERFWDKVDMTGGPNECWLWMAVRTSAGYGWMSVSGTQVYAHRLVLTLTGRDIPEGAEVMHTCDNPPCVNPAHLVIGSRAENAQDMVAKGRQGRGESHSQAKLSRSDVREIRTLCARGHSQAEIAARYGVTPPAVSLIKTRKRWSHI